MAKQKTAFFCSNCGVESSKWIGKCPSCGEWNSYIEEPVIKSVKSASGKTRDAASPKLVTDITIAPEPRLNTKSVELNRVLGGGLVPGSVILIGGEPGIGKSTLMLQFSLRVSSYKIMYVSGEESEQQLKLRADRIGGKGENCYIYCESILENILLQFDKVNPDIIIIDSIQTIQSERIESSPGTVVQVRECTASLLKYAKENNKPIFLIGHINKEGNIAGPKVLEHMVDTVLAFEGDLNNLYRILRSTKNRFGSTSEIGIFEMQSTGLKEVPNPSDILLSHTDEILSGTVVAATIEGIRPILIEVQALVSSAAYGNPQRSSMGFDLRRLGMLLAVLEKRAGFRLSAKDVFLNIAGGLKVSDPAIDLAVIAAVLSSDLDRPVSKDICIAGEIGLTGEVRPVSRVEQRIGEAEKLGFKKMLISKYGLKGIDLSKYKIQIFTVAKVEEAFKILFH
ncbi:MAG: DNA repair protein RadA [Bacteroidia bacterium]|nr:DNA repair protein RadA [Bacteroidia bacterium]